MNLAWLVSRTGAPQARNVHAPDRGRLKRDGYSLYTLEWTAPDGRKRQAPVHAQRSPTETELRAGAEAIFGASGGTVRLLDETGAEVTASTPSLGERETRSTPRTGAERQQE